MSDNQRAVYTFAHLIMLFVIFNSYVIMKSYFLVCYKNKSKIC